MLRASWCLGYRTEIEDSLRCQVRQGTLEAASRVRLDDSRLARKPLSPTIDNNLLGVGLRLTIGFELNKGVDKRVQPAPCLNVIKPRDEDVELLIERDLLVLNFSDMGGYLDAGAAG